jgi:hypothetical protein
VVKVNIIINNDLYLHNDIIGIDEVIKMETAEIIPQLLKRKLKDFNEEWTIAIAHARSAFSQRNAHRSNTGMFWGELEALNIEAIRQFYEGGNIIINEKGKNTFLRGEFNIIHDHFEKFPHELNTQVKEALLSKIQNGWDRYAQSLISSAQFFPPHLNDKQKEHQKQVFESGVQKVKSQCYRKLDLLLDEMIALNAIRKNDDSDSKRKLKSIFISYSNDDKTKMQSLCRFIRKKGKFQTVVVANRRNSGMALSDKVAKNILSSDILIPILTQNSIQNQWVNQEIGFATALNRTIIPLVDNAIMDALKGFITKYIDLCYSFQTDQKSRLRDRILFSNCYRKLFDDLENGGIPSPILNNFNLRNKAHLNIDDTIKDTNIDNMVKSVESLQKQLSNDHRNELLRNASSALDVKRINDQFR